MQCWKYRNSKIYNRYIYIYNENRYGRTLLINACESGNKEIKSQ